MNTEDAAKILRYTPRYVTHLIRQGRLKAEKSGPRSWEIDANSVKEFLSTYNHAEEAQSPPPDGTVEVPPEIVKLMEELEKENIFITDRRISMAELFRELSQYFMAGIQPGSIYPTLAMTLPDTDDGDKAEIANEAYLKLMHKLRTLRLVRNGNLQVGRKWYIVTVTTELGAKVIRALKQKNKPLS